MERRIPEHRSARPRPSVSAVATSSASAKRSRTCEVNDEAIFDRIADAYAAFNRRDIDRALTVMHFEVEWENGMEGGFVHGHDAVRSYWTRQWQVLDPTVEPIAFAEDHADASL